MATLHIEKSDPLTIKELAWELGVSVKYVELMHAAGFPMTRRLLDGYGARPVLSATADEARAWREAIEFRLVHCHPVLTVGQMRFGFRLENWTPGMDAAINTQSQIAARI